MRDSDCSSLSVISVHRIAQIHTLYWIPLHTQMHMYTNQSLLCFCPQVLSAVWKLQGKFCWGFWCCLKATDWYCSLSPTVVYRKSSSAQKRQLHGCLFTIHGNSRTLRFIFILQTQPHSPPQRPQIKKNRMSWKYKSMHWILLSHEHTIH